MEEKQKINIEIADRKYPLSIAPEREQMVRKAVSKVNEKVAMFMQKYARRDVQDALSIAVLELALELIKLEQHISDAMDFEQELVLLDNQLEEYLNNLK